MPKTRFHRGSDPWGRGSYPIPYYAVVGASDCGNWPDSPAQTEKVLAELKRFRRDMKKETGVSSRLGRATQSGNVFMIKRWVVVSADDFLKAVGFARIWLKEHNHDTRYIHDADLSDHELVPKVELATV